MINRSHNQKLWKKIIRHIILGLIGIGNIIAWSLLQLMFLVGAKKNK